MDKFKNYIEEAKVAKQQEIEAILNDGRADDAKPFRASLNIYDVFLAFATASEKKANGDKEATKEGFHKLAVNVPAGWKKSLELAKAHNDAEKVMIEEAKLATADEIIKKFNELF